MKLVQEEKKVSLKTMVNLGSDFYVQASVYAHAANADHAAPRAHARVSACRPDTSCLFVNVGLGFHAEMTLDEAATFATAREAALSTKVEALTAKAARLKAHIKLVVGAIDELMGREGPAARARDIG